MDQCSHVLGKYDLTLATFQINSELICVCVIPPNALAHHMNVQRPECADGEYHRLSVDVNTAHQTVIQHVFTNTLH